LDIIHREELERMLKTLIRFCFPPSPVLAQLIGHEAVLLNLDWYYAQSENPLLPEQDNYALAQALEDAENWVKLNIGLPVQCCLSIESYGRSGFSKTLSGALVIGEDHEAWYLIDWSWKIGNAKGITIGRCKDISLEEAQRLFREIGKKARNAAVLYMGVLDDTSLMYLLARDTAKPQDDGLPATGLTLCICRGTRNTFYPVSTCREEEDKVLYDLKDGSLTLVNPIIRTDPPRKKATLRLHGRVINVIPF
jgi:hypothetical protein